MQRSIALAWTLLVTAGCSGPRDVPAAQPSATVVASTTASASAATSAAPSSTASLDPNAPPLSEAALMHEVEFLASHELRGRGSATEDERRAADHLVASVKAIGLEPLGADKKFEQTFTPRKSATSTNVFGRLASTASNPKNGVVVVGAHFDHLGVRGDDVYYGADDNASGVAGILGVARSLSKRRGELGRDVVFVFFGSEEIGLVGSERFVAEGPLPTKDMFAMINVDMIGRPLQDQILLRPVASMVGIDLDHSLGVDGLRNRPKLAKAVRDACEKENERPITIDDLPAEMRATAEVMTRGRGDNWSFESAGVPAVFFSSAESSDYHKPTDTPDTLSPELLAERARIIERAVIAISNLDRVD